MGFRCTAPLVVKKVGKDTPAGELGVEVGWTLIGINKGESGSMDSREFCQILKTAVDSLAPASTTAKSTS